MAESVRLNVLGDLQVIGPNGSIIELPASRKTKALLAYLGLTRRRQFREHLCSLLWNDAEDPRGALRWSLSRLRAALDGPEDRRLHSDRKSISLAEGAFSIDLDEVKLNLRKPLDSVALDTLRAAARSFRGELLEGVDLLEAFRFQAWCMSQREAARTIRRRLLTALSDRVEDFDEALGYARQLVSIDPLSEEAHTRVIRLLIDAQRATDADEQATTYRRTLEIELGEVPRDVAARLRKLVHDDGFRPAQAPRELRAAPAPVRQIDSLPLVGRAGELALLQAWLADDRPDKSMAIIAGEPGVGKTRLMTEAVAAAPDDALIVAGRAYRAETARALGPWRDALQAIAGAETVLNSAGDGVTEQQKRTQLFDELLALMTSHTAPGRRLIVTLDDVQWMDEASAAFTHFLARQQLDNVHVVATLRPAEILDNPAVAMVLESLRGHRTVLDLELSALGRKAIAQLCSSVGAGNRADEVFERSDGNAFLAIELALALARGETALPTSTQHLVEARLSVLSDGARDLLPWAAALGRTFHIDILERVTGFDQISLVGRIGELEQRGVFAPRENGTYDFVHDLVRDAAYRELSAPRRRIVHRRIARALATWTIGERLFSAAELLRHAELGGESALACKASAAAAKDALNVYAWIDVCVLADRGLQHTSSVEPIERVELLLNLLNCRIAATSVLERHHPEHVRNALTEVLQSTASAKQSAEALYLQAIVFRDDGHSVRAGDSMVAAADAGRQGDAETSARQIANSARCLLHLEREVSKARTLLAEASNELKALGLPDVELLWGEALLARWDGNLNEAAVKLHEAIELAKKQNLHWRQSSCLTALIMIAHELGESDKVEELSSGRLLHGEDSGTPLASPFVEALAALADFRRDSKATARLFKATDVLRDRDAQAQLAYVVAATAQLHLMNGDMTDAREAASEAASIGEQLQRLVVQADALVTLAEIALTQGEVTEARERLRDAAQVCSAPDSVTSWVQSRLDSVTARL